MNIDEKELLRALRSAAMEMGVGDTEHSQVLASRVMAKLKEPKPWPQDYDRVFVLRLDGGCAEICYQDDDLFAKAVLKHGMLFPDTADAERKRLQLESMANPWKPEEGQRYYTIDSSGNHLESVWRGDSHEWLRCNLGLCFPTKEARDGWFEKYWSVWFEGPEEGGEG